VTPFVDRLRPLIDLREQVVSFPAAAGHHQGHLVVGIDTVIYFQVTDPKSATYEIANYVAAVEQLTVTTLRNVVCGMDLDTTLTSRDFINGELRKELDEATGRWGLRVSRVELKSIEPPASIQGSMEKQMRADRDKRAAILIAEGAKQVGPPDRRGREAGGRAARGEGLEDELGPGGSGRPTRAGRPGSAARRRRSRRSSSAITRAIPISGCSPTSTWRCSLSSRRAARTRCGSVPSELGKGARGHRRLLRQRRRRRGGQAVPDGEGPWHCRALRGGNGKRYHRLPI